MKLLTVEKLVLDVPLTLVHVIQSLVQEIANGLLGTHGANARQHVVEELRTEQGQFYKRQLMEVKSVKEKRHNSRTVTHNYAQLTVRGARGVTGTRAQEHVVVECKQELEAFCNKKGTVESHAKAIHKKCRDVTCKPVQYARIIQDMHDSAQHGQFTVLTASLSRDVAKSPADCAKEVQNDSTFLTTMTITLMITINFYLL